MTNNPKRVCILTGVHLCHNPRVTKEATALAQAGFDVTILGGFLDAGLKLRDQQLLKGAHFKFIPVLDVTHSLVRKAFSVSRIGKFFYRITGQENSWQLGNSYRRLTKFALNADADLYICHMEQALAVGSRLLHNRRRVAIDMEDWYSEDLLPQARKYRPIQLLRRLEQRLLADGAFAICPSHAMAEAIALAYGCSPPAVIYNAFPWTDRQGLRGEKRDRRDSSKPSIYWFSQTLGRERGLEDLVLSLPFIKRPVEIHLRGKPALGFKEWFEEQIPAEWKDKVFFHFPVRNSELLSRVAEHDIGFAGERLDPPSKNLTVSNKLFHYLLGGLAIIASNTAGQREIADKAGEAIRLYESKNPRSLADQLNSLLATPAALEAAKAAALRSARSEFCWEAQESLLVDLVAGSLKAKIRRPLAADLASAADISPL